MANTAQLSPDELAKQQKALEVIGEVFGIDAAAVGSRRLPSAPPADITKAARPLTGGASTPPPSAVGGMGPSTPPPANGFTPTGVTGGLAPYVKPSIDMRERLTPSDTSSIPEGDGGIKSNMAAKYQNGQLIKVGTSEAQAINEGAQVVPGVEPSTRGAYISPKKAEQLTNGMTKKGDALVAKTKEVADAVSKWWNTPSQTKEEYYRNIGKNLGAK